MTTHQPLPPPSRPAVPPAPRPATAEQVRRREWPAALRWFGQRNRRVENWMSAEHLAERIEGGTLTPWADTNPVACPNCRGTGAAAHPLVPSRICEDCKGTGTCSPPADTPEPDEPVADVLAAFERGPHGVTAPPPPRVEASGVKLDEPSGQRTAAAAAQALDLCAAPVAPTPPATDGTGPILGRALLDVDGELLRQVGPDRWQDFAGAEYRRAEVEADGPVREVLLVDPAAAQVLEAAREWREADRAELTAARTADTPDAGEAEWLASRQLATEEALATAVDALGDTTEAEPTPEPAATANLATASHGLAKPNPPPAGGSGWVDRRAWTRQQWLDDARAIFNSVHGGAADLLNGHIMALFGELHDVTEQRDLAIAHDRQPYPTAAAYEAVCATLERKRRALDAARAELAQVTGRLRAALDAGQDVPDADLVSLAGTHREALAGAVRANQEQTAEVERLRAELATTRGAAAAAGAGWDREAADLARRDAELAEAVEANHRWAADHAEQAAELATARRDAELWERAAGDMEARDRHAAADTLDWAAGQWVREVVGVNEFPTPAILRGWAAEVRAGTRPVPGSPKPDGGGDDAG
jgi:hypothetical protein